MRRATVCIGSILAACGGGGAKPATTTTAAPAAPTGPSEADLAAQHAREEQAHRDEVVASHRKLEAEQQDALALACDTPGDNHARCAPSCYTAEPRDPRAGKKVRGMAEIQHLVCQHGSDGAPAIFDELNGKLAVRELRGRPAKAHKKGTWQADVETALAHDAVIVTGMWHDVTQPVTKERLRCVTASHYASLHRPLDACGGAGEIVCEASGNPAAHGLNVVHFRLVEARQLQAASNTTGCQQAALEAIAVARGMPRWRQYAKLNVDQWPKNARFRTRFDGILDEDALFDAAAALGSEAEAVYAACGGAQPAATTPDQEQSFHGCW